MPAQTSRHARPTRSAERSALFEALNSQWATVAESRQLRQRLGEWSTHKPILSDYPDGTSLMAVLRDVGADDELRRSLLEAVAEQATSDDLAMTVTLAALLPRLARLVNRSACTGVDLDDRCATVLSIAHETVTKCRPGTASSWYDRRLWCNISKRYYRWVKTQATSADAEAQLLGALSVTGVDEIVGPYDPAIATALTLKPEPVGEAFAVDQLCDWVAERASVDLGTARLIVLTRAGGVPVEDLVGIEGASAQSIRRRRLRAEQRLATAMAAA